MTVFEALHNAGELQTTVVGAELGPNFRRV
jgi:hypothetical protein